MTAVRTVLGDLPPAELGITDAHDHLFMRSAALPGQDLDDAEAAAAELRRFAALGGRTVVQWSPFGMGRRPAELVELSRATGVQVIAATGLHRAAHYPPGRPERWYPRLADLFVEELTTGLHTQDDPDSPLTGARAGLIKVAGDFHHLDAHTRTVMTAAAQAHHRTGAPVGVHLEHGSAAADVLELLCAGLGVPPSRVILGHLNRFPDLGAHRAAARAGAFLGFDGPSLANHETDWRLVDTLVSLAGDGHADQLLLGADTTSAAARGNPGLTWLLTRLRPRLVEELGEEFAGAMFVRNPARAFAVEWVAGS
ncbi:phosphotriesterase [Pseudonocardia eucalypti]|uniref:Phosphotriesterase n=1 Tax=Pseudonocardia eucalypti TaxID=648755 RepID=A0ABP9Q9K2_9PSEU|nr:phosphotriesterase-related protein [Pseudonocardia eucalypti]